MEFYRVNGYQPDWYQPTFDYYFTSLEKATQKFEDMSNSLITNWCYLSKYTAKDDGTFGSEVIDFFRRETE